MHQDGSGEPGTRGRWDAACPISTGGRTRRVHIVRGEPGTRGRWRPVALALDAVVAEVGEPIAEVVRCPRRERKAQVALLVQPHAHLGRQIRLK